MTEDELTSAIAERPEDVDAVAVYGDWLADRGDPLGEYINVCCKLDRLDDGAPAERLALLARSYELRTEHDAAWLARWNDPVPLFDDSSYRFCGLPNSLELESLPADIAAFERQIARLPISSVQIRGLKLAELAQLEDLPLLRRIRALSFLTRYPERLDRDLPRWIADRALGNLTRLGLYDVPMSTSDLPLMLDSMPALASLSVYRTELSHDAVAAMTATAAARTVEWLSIRHTRIGNALIAALGAWPALRSIDVASASVDDSIAELPETELPITSIDISDNAGLGPTGLAWIARTMPRLASIELPTDLGAAEAHALEPIVAGLDSLTIGYAPERRAVENVVSVLLPRARSLRHLELRGGSAGLVAPMIEIATLEDLTVQDIGDADLERIATTPRARPLKQLDVSGDITDAGLAILARSPQLTGLTWIAVSGETLTEVGLAHLIAAPWPQLEWVFAIGVQITDPEPLLIPRPALELDLFQCSIDDAAAARLRAVWGARLRVRT